MSLNNAQALGEQPLISGVLDWVPGVDLRPPVHGEEKGACKLTVDLIRVIYMGEDIGSEWRYWIWVDNSLWDSGERNLKWQEIDILDVRIYERNVGPCEGSWPLYIRVRARERDRLLDDIGSEFRTPTLRCIKPRDEQPISVPVPVPERSLLPWLTRRVAVLRFDFLLTTECINIGGTKPPNL